MLYPLLRCLPVVFLSRAGFSALPTLVNNKIDDIYERNRFQFSSNDSSASLETFHSPAGTGTAVALQGQKLRRALDLSALSLRLDCACWPRESATHGTRGTFMLRAYTPRNQRLLLPETCTGDETFQKKVFYPSWRLRRANIRSVQCTRMFDSTCQKFSNHTCPTELRMGS